MSRRLAIPIALAALLVGATIWWLTTGGGVDPGPVPLGADPPLARPSDAGSPAGDADTSMQRVDEPPSPPETSRALLFGIVSDLAGERLEGARVFVRLVNDLPYLL